MACIKNLWKVNKITSWTKSLFRISSNVKSHTKYYLEIFADIIPELFSMSEEYWSNFFYFFRSSFFCSFFVPYLSMGVTA